MSEFLHRLARTAALCGALGLLLYLALSSAAEHPVTAPAIGLVGAGVVGVMVFGLLREAWRSGVMPERFGIVTSRESTPVWYWTSMLWYGACLICLVALALMCLVRIVGL